MDDAKNQMISFKPLGTPVVRGVDSYMTECRQCRYVPDTGEDTSGWNKHFY